MLFSGPRKQLPYPCNLCVFWSLQRIWARDIQHIIMLNKDIVYQLEKHTNPGDLFEHIYLFKPSRYPAPLIVLLFLILHPLDVYL